MTACFRQTMLLTVREGRPVSDGQRLVICRMSAPGQVEMMKGRMRTWHYRMHTGSIITVKS